jgi:hypothetical protein
LQQTVKRQRAAADGIHTDYSWGLLRVTAGTTQGHARQRKVERAMRIEPIRAVLPELKNKRFGAMADPKCD